ncbi:MAG: thiamine pyrophosphate-dependent enzyme [Acidimicrobiales bacterium]
METEPVQPGSVEAASLPAGAPVLPAGALLGLFDAMVQSREVDLVARELREAGEGYYTIASAGHEANAAVAWALRPSDPALLHYRSGGFYMARASQAGAGGGRYDGDPMLDVLLGMVASTEDPASGGRHKVFGHPDLAIIPQTSTIASHLPRAVGLAFSIGLARKLGTPTGWPEDAVVVASFGDASANHSTALGAMNTAAWCAYQRVPLPLLFVCEDNGLGISVRSPSGWLRAAWEQRSGLEYFAADGCDLGPTYAAAAEAAGWARSRRSPALLHLSMVRLLGHAGSDVELAYRSAAEISADVSRDPLLVAARRIVAGGAATAKELRERHRAIAERARALAARAVTRRRLGSADEIMRPIYGARAGPAPGQGEPCGAHAAFPVAAEPERRRAFGGRLPEEEGPLTLAQSVNRCLVDLLAAIPSAVVFGQDVAAKGGVYGVTKGLVKAAGKARVFDTLLDEQSILGLALGAGIAGFVPFPEVQYLAYLHNAEDQLRGEAATLAFFSNGSYRNPMVVRIAAYAYQEGFGGHFHNDSSVAVLRDIPGLVVASPALPDDAAAMLRTCAAAAADDGAVCVFLEPIARYHTRDLYSPGDGAWLAGYRGPGAWGSSDVPIGRGRLHGSGRDLSILTFANGLYMSLRVARRLESAGIGCRVLDLRWLSPLPVEQIAECAEATGRVLVVDETRSSGGVSEGVLAALADAGYIGRAARVAGRDSFVPLGDAAYHVLVSEPEIEKAALELMGR